jgi:small subunit ribosomal protein S7
MAEEKRTEEKPAEAIVAEEKAKAAAEAATAAAAAESAKTTMAVPKQKLFGKYDYDVAIRDRTLEPYISLKPVELPHSFARHANKAFAKSRLNIVERLANKLMRGGTGEKLGGKVIRTQGRLQGKKARVLRIIEEAMDAAAAKTKKNPLQLLVQAIENVAPREDVTRIRLGGVSYQVATDVSPLRRLDMALRNIALAAITSAFNKKITVAQALAQEIELAAANSQDSYAVKRKNETERIATSAR